MLFLFLPNLSPPHFLLHPPVWQMYLQQYFLSFWLIQILLYFQLPPESAAVPGASCLCLQVELTQTSKHCKNAAYFQLNSCCADLSTIYTNNWLFWVKCMQPTSPWPRQLHLTDTGGKHTLYEVFMEHYTWNTFTTSENSSTVVFCVVWLYMPGF